MINTLLSNTNTMTNVTSRYFKYVVCFFYGIPSFNQITVIIKLVY